MAGRLTPGTGSQIIMEAWGSYSRVQYSRCLILARGPPLHFSLGPSKGKTVWAPLLSTNVSSAGCSAANPATTGTIEADAPLIQRKHFLSSAAPQTGWDVTGRRLAWTAEHFQTSRTDGCLIKWRLPLIQLVWSPDRRRNFSFDWFCIISPNQRPVAVWINRRIVGPDYRWRWNNHKKAQYCFFFPAFKKPPPHYSQIKMARWFTLSLSPVAEPSARPHLSTHAHVCTRTHLYTRVTYVHAREQGQPLAEDSAPLWSCLLAFHFAAPQAQHTHTHTRTNVLMSHTNADMAAESVVNRSLPAFHFCGESIGLCRTQHLIEAHKVTDYWIVTYCIEGCFANAPPSRRLRNASTVALSIASVPSYEHFIAEKRKKSTLRFFSATILKISSIKCI